MIWTSILFIFAFCFDLQIEAILKFLLIKVNDNKNI